MFNFVSRSVVRAAAVTAGLAVTAALAVTATTAAPPMTGTATDRTSETEASKTELSEPLTQPAAADGTGLFPLIARNKDGRLFDYEPKGTGGFTARFDLGGGYSGATALVQTNISRNLTGTDLYVRMGGTLYYAAERGGDTKVIGTGWDQFNLLVSAGNLGGSAHPDLLARHTADGSLWLYQGKADGGLAAKVQVGKSGWNGMDELTGRGDYTGDGKADLIARTTAGALYIYPGTGNATADAVFGTRVAVAATGTAWKDYTALFSTGDNDGDGKTDLLGTDAAGALWLSKGTGKSSAPFAARTQLGASGWGQYNLLF
jgi:hypothetical protein